MKVSEFKRRINEMAADCMGLRKFASYLKQDSRDDKQLREELLAVYAVVKHRGSHDDADVDIGGEKHDYDACLDHELIEIAQALPDDKHKIRISVATGSTTPFEYFKHARDHLQFPDAIIAAINKKHLKHYADTRTLVVVFDGDYSQEDDSIITDWISEVRTKTNRGTFQHILLVERNRMKAFDVF